MLKTIQILNKAGIFTFKGLCHLLGSVNKHGVNLLALLRYSSKNYPKQIAVTDENETLTYEDLYRQSANLAHYFSSQCGIRQYKKVAIICRNHIAQIRTLFAISGTGADLYLLSPDMSKVQLSEISNQFDFDLIVHDPDVTVEGTLSVKTIISNQAIKASVELISMERLGKGNNVKRKRNGQLIVFSGGTTGKGKTAARKPSLFNFLSPMVELIEKCDLTEVKSAYIATPVYHGFGLAALVLSITLGKRIFTLKTFDANKASDLIAQNKIECLCVVPLMLRRMIGVNLLKNNQLKCIISGGATIGPDLVKQTQNLAGNILCNLYGTSEAGFCILATPANLEMNTGTIGLPVRGVAVSILNEENKQAGIHVKGRLCIKSKWSINSKEWIETGDIAYRDELGNYFLCSRVDDMIVSGGENVYPADLESVLEQHPSIENVAVIGVEDKDFGHRLVAYIEVKDSGSLTEMDVISWLSGKVARYQMPREIEFIDAMPYTSLGKVDKKALREMHNKKMANKV